jgi:hypothetical protein
MVEGSPKGRLTIEERAQKRERISADGGERYDRLVDTLREGRPARTGREAKFALQWNPVARKLLVAGVVVVLLYLAVRTGTDMLRDARVDTWTGQDATVQSGQRLAGCPEVEGLHDDVFPTWVRYGGAVYGMVDLRRVVVEMEGQPNLTRTGYRLGDIELLVEDFTEPGRRRDFVILHLLSSQAGQVFRRTGCA